MISSEKVGKQISMLRKEKQLSQEQLAEQLNVSAQAVSKWETGKSLPETATLPLLSSVLGHSIDSILLPQELVILSALYTDGHEEHDVTHFVNQFVTGNRLALTVSDHIFPKYMNSSRLKLLLIKYQTPTGIFSTYALKGTLLEIDLYTKDPVCHSEELEFVTAVYGNELNHCNVLNKMKHYQYFHWNYFTATHELLPSLIENEGHDYLLLVYRNASGVHAISCLEGEQIHYNADRTQLSRKESSHNSYIIENVDRLGFGRGMDCSWAGALYVALKVTGVSVSYENIMGVSGACWRAAFTPVWDYSAADALAAYDYAAPAFKAYGLSVNRTDRIASEERKLEKQLILESIRNHRLPLAINLRVAPEWGVITGYLDNGRTLLCRSYFDDETFEELQDNREFIEDMKISKGYLHVDNWPYLIMRYSDQGQIPLAIDSLYASLRIKVDSMSFEEKGGYKLGIAALETWREGLLDDHWYQAAKEEDFMRRLGVNHFCMMALVDARRSAAVYLKEALPLLDHPSEFAYLSEMAEVYDQMYSSLEVFYQSMVSPISIKSIPSPKLFWTREHREQQAELLQLIIALEKRGNELAKHVLAISDRG